MRQIVHRSGGHTASRFAAALALGAALAACQPSASRMPGEAPPEGGIGGTGNVEEVCRDDAPCASVIAR
jgi:hypothetical protein